MVHYVFCLLRSEAEMQCFVQFVWKFCCDTRCVTSCLAKVREVRLSNVSCNLMSQLCQQEWSERLQYKTPAQGFRLSILILKAKTLKDTI